MTTDLARLWAAIAAHQPGRPALRHAGTTVTWGQFDRAAAAVANRLRAAGLGRGAVAALCLRNKPEYLVILAGTLRSGIAPCGINYRYTSAELADLFSRLQPAVVFHDAADESTVRDALTRSAPFAVPMKIDRDDSAADALSVDRLLGDPPTSTAIVSAPDDVLLKATGGTTGTPTAFRWRVSDLLQNLNTHNPWTRHDLNPTSAGRPVLRLVDAPLLVASPLIHGSGLTRALGALCAGGTVTTLPEGPFDPRQALDTASANHIDTLAIVGDAHALPLADALDAQPGRWPLPVLATISSSGTSWSQDTQKRLLTHLPHVRLAESLGSTEATGLGFRSATATAIPPAAQFQLGPHAAVFTSEGELAATGAVGQIGVSWPHPAGLHPTGEIPADRFVSHSGRRSLLSGDHVRLVDENHFLLLGRDIDCINTGGEKVYAPEVIAALLSHPNVADAAVFGVPHRRLGQAVAALVQLTDPGALDLLQDHLDRHLASYKRPTALAAVTAIPRSEAGKLNLAGAHSLLDQGQSIDGLPRRTPRRTSG